MAQINLFWAGLNAGVRGAAASLRATTVVMGGHGCVLSGLQGSAELLEFLSGENGACFRCAHAAGLHSAENL